MAKLRYFVVPLERRWTIRRASRRIGAFGDEWQAVTMAVEIAAIERVHGHAVEVLHRDPDGRWERVVRLETGA
jgi:hypothetical protein